MHEIKAGTIRERVIALAIERKISQKELATRLHTSPTTVHGWFHCENRNPSAEFLIPICELFSVSLEWLLTGNDPAPAPTSADSSLTELEQTLIEAFRAVGAEGKLRIIQSVMNIKDAEDKKISAAG